MHGTLSGINKTLSDSNEIQGKQKKTDVVLAVVGCISVCVTSAAIITAWMLTKQTHIQARSLQIQTDAFDLTKRQTIAVEEQARISREDHEREH